MREEKLESGTAICTAGTPVEEFIFVVHGVVKVMAFTPTGCVETKTMSDGAYFGGIVFEYLDIDPEIEFESDPHECSATCLKECKVFRMSLADARRAYSSVSGAITTQQWNHVRKVMDMFSQVALARETKGKQRKRTLKRWDSI